MPRRARSQLGFEIYAADRTKAGITSVHRGFSELSSGVSKEAGIASRAIGGALMGNATFAAAAAGAAMLSFSASAISAFVQVERQWAEVTTLLPLSTKAATDKMLADVRGFSKEAGFIIEDSIGATYQALSAGIPEADIKDFLYDVGQSARAGLTGITTAVDATTSVLNAYNLAASETTNVSDAMFTAIRLGKTTFEEMAPVLGPVLPIAASLNTEFVEITGALAALTAQGNPTSVALTQIRSALVALSKDTEARALFEAVTGQTYAEFQSSGGTLAEALKIVRVEADRTGKNIVDVFGRVEAANAAVALTSEKGAATFVAAMTDIEDATADAAAKMSASTAVMHEQLMAQLNDVRLSAGSMLTTLSTFALEALGIVDTRSIGIVQRVQEAATAIAEGQKPTTITQWWEDPEDVVRLWNIGDPSLLPNAEQFAWREVREAFTQGQIHDIMRSLGMPVGPSAADIAMLSGGDNRRTRPGPGLHRIFGRDARLADGTMAAKASRRRRRGG